MQSSLYRGLREKYPKHTIKLATSQVYQAGALVEIAQHNPFIDEIHNIDPLEMTSKETKECWGVLYANVPSIEDSLFWKKADLAVCENTPCVRHEWPAMKTEEGIVKPRYVAWCDAAGVVPSTYAPVYRVTRDEHNMAKSYLQQFRGQPVVGVGLASADTRRALSLGALTAICSGLRDAGVRPITLDHTARIEGFDSIIGKRVSETIALISEMDAIISCDSGILHMAGAVGTPVIGVFGPTDYLMRTAMYKGSFIDSRKLVDCAPCWYKYGCLTQEGNGHKELECMSRIRPSVVVEETLRWLK
jgi:ADP-heptose:LPS heptosyltransferase